MNEEKDETPQYITLKEAAAKWHTNPGYLRKACNMGQVTGAAKLGDEWIIPADMERPQMKVPHEPVAPRVVEHGSEYKDQIYRLTMKGFPDFNIVTKKIGNTTYTISSCFSPDASETLEEKVFRLAVREAEKEFGIPYATPDTETMKKIREEALSRLPSDDETKEYYRSRFTEIGFSEDEISELMAKIEEHIATRNAVLKKK